MRLDIAQFYSCILHHFLFPPHPSSCGFSQAPVVTIPQRCWTAPLNPVLSQPGPAQTSVMGE